MFNRTLLTMSANRNGLNFGTRSLAKMAGANVGGTLRVRTYYPHARTESLRLGLFDDFGSPSIPGGQWSSSIPSSPADLSGQALTACLARPRVVVGAVLPKVPQGVVYPDVPPCAPVDGRTARRAPARQRAPKPAAPRATRPAAVAGSIGTRQRRESSPLTTATTLTAPGAFPASGG